MADAESNLHEVNGRMVWDGFRELIPLSVFVTLFGAAFGLAAVQSGLDDLTIVAMSTLVFAGASQFAALELWGEQVPIFTLAITVFAINARHLLMGATLYPWLRQLPPGRRYGVMLTASDANWAAYRPALTAAFAEAGLDATLTRATQGKVSKVDRVSRGFYISECLEYRP